MGLYNSVNLEYIRFVVNLKILGFNDNQRQLILSKFFSIIWIADGLRDKRFQLILFMFFSLGKLNFLFR